MIVSQRNLLRCVFAALIDNPRATLSAKAQKGASILSRVSDRTAEQKTP
jgi:hypothetical protein